MTIKIASLVGQRFGKWTVLELDKSRSSCGKGTFWICKCDCGTIKSTASGDLKRGETTQCNVCASKQRGLKNTVHGDSQTRLYNCWKSMVRRCEVPTQKGYCWYGGRGIKVCEEWHNYLKFKEWALQNGFKEDIEIDRINSEGNYDPSNCKWSTEKEQQRNRRNNISLTCNGETHILVEWSEILGIKLDTLYKRLYISNWSVEKTLTTPLNTTKSFSHHHESKS